MHTVENEGAQWFSGKFAKGSPILGLIAFLLTSFIFNLPRGPMLYTPSVWIYGLALKKFWQSDG